MDYSTAELRLRPGQIRLITILPPERAGDVTEPIRCKIENYNLPAGPPKNERPDTLPDNYIHFDHWVTNKPEESLGALLLREVRQAEAFAEGSEKETKGHRTLRGIANGARWALKRPPIKSHDLRVPLQTLFQLVTQDDIANTIRSEELNGGFTISRPLNRHGNPLPEHQQYIAHVKLKDVPQFYRSYHKNTDPAAPVNRSNNYVAMSYSWGPPRPTRVIFLNGVAQEVGVNLEEGLRQFRNMEYFQKGGKIWIDALCINQADEKEKNAQVKRMGAIYRQAGNIIVWLGVADEHTDAAIDSLHTTSLMYRSEYMEAFDNSDPILATAHREISYMRQKSVLQRYTRLLYDHYHEMDTVQEDFLTYHFFNNPYWRRLWIIQELSNGRSGMPIVYGSRVTQWRYIRDAAFVYTAFFDLLQERTQELPDHMPGLQLKDHSVFQVAGIGQIETHSHRKKLPDVDRTFLPFQFKNGLGHGPMRGSTLRQALMLASQADCYNTKDRVYGMLEIPGLPDLGITVDYDKKVGQIYREFTQAFIEKGKSLDVFFLLDGCGMSLTDINGVPHTEFEILPSWVPDFGGKRSRRPGIIEGTWHASGNQQGFVWEFDGIAMPIEPATNDEILRCFGFVVETVSGLGAINPRDVHGNQVVEASWFQSGVVQPRAPDPLGRSDTDQLASRLRNMFMGTSSNLPRSALHDDDEDFEAPNIDDVLVAGTRIGGARAPADFKCLLDIFSEDEPSPDHPDYHNWHFVNSSASLRVGGRPLSSYFSPPPLVRTEAPYILTAARQAMQSHTHKRRLAVSASGRLGLVPIATQPGDSIIILIGHGIPIVARPAGAVNLPSGQEHPAWTIMGECFVDGMMMGEMMTRDIFSGRKMVKPLFFV
ncbi:heterokaryon incompatibility protein [Phlyctema vagabunda]|uniref:Heterokaryon incompatibility protein n=1 Tax=Phlyctema vagabunda TaxID=108571 RepID=A0ABR4PK01_9HELO